MLSKLQNSQPFLGKRPLKPFWFFLNRMRSSYVLGVASSKQDCVDVNQSVKPISDIPGPSGHWLKGLLGLFLEKGGIYRGIYGYHESLLRDYGEIVKQMRSSVNEVWVFDPDAVMTVFRADSKHPLRRKLVALDKIRDSIKKEAGVFFLSGEKWYKHRSVLSKRMLRPPEISQYVPRLNAIADDVMDRISQIRHPSGHQKQFEIDKLDQELFQWSFESVGDLLFDRRFGAVSANPPKDAVEFVASVTLFLENLVPLLTMPPAFYEYYQPKFYKACTEGLRNMYRYAEKFIYEKMNELEQREKCSLLAQKDTEIEEFIPFLLASGKIKPEEICSSIVDTLFAGVDTTSNTMQWMLYLLSKNQDKQETLHKEVDRVTGLAGNFSADSIAQLHYVRAVIKETLRLYPIVIGHSRILSKDVVLSGYHVPAGTTVVISNHVMGRNPNVFDSPTEFRPERWLRNNNYSDFISYASLPFGHGVRMCLGRRLAELELQLLLVKIIQKYKLSYATDEVVVQYMRGTSIPDRPLRVKFENRK